MDAQGAGELRDTLDEINARLTEKVQSGEMDESQKNHLIDWMQRVLQKLTVKYKNVSREVDEVMGGYILHTRTDDILDAGRAEGRTEGRTEGRELDAIEMLKDDMPEDKIAKYTQLTIERIKELRNKLMNSAAVL